jgi:hypothetical protein
MCTPHMLMRFCHLINRSLACKAKEERHIGIHALFYFPDVSADRTAFRGNLFQNGGKNIVAHIAIGCYDKQ